MKLENKGTIYFSAWRQLNSVSFSNGNSFYQCFLMWFTINNFDFEWFGFGQLNRPLRGPHIGFIHEFIVRVVRAARVVFSFLACKVLLGACWLLVLVRLFKRG